MEAGTEMIENNKHKILVIFIYQANPYWSDNDTLMKSYSYLNVIDLYDLTKKMFNIGWNRA